ncbi:MAG: 50S ribosomal protein L29 [Erysipelotrichaceae bacterium]|nr:50S ribosomal protein L29 [Erysipelotrichaceae bacterium]
MKINEIRAKSDEELQKDIGSLTAERFNLRFSASTGQLTNTARIKQVNKTIARILTVLSERKAQGK